MSQFHLHVTVEITGEEGPLASQAVHIQCGQQLLNGLNIGPVAQHLKRLVQQEANRVLHPEAAKKKHGAAGQARKR